MHKFDKAALTYSSHNLLQRQAAAILYDMLPANASSILDLGCGPGSSLTKLKQIYNNQLVLAMDLSPKMARIANTISPTVIADACNLPFKQNSFDLVFSNLVIQWLLDLEQIFTNILAITAYNGEIIGSTLGNNSLIEARTALASIDRAENINNFHEMQIIGDMLSKTGWQEIYTASENIEIEHNTPESVFQTLKQTGANTMLNSNAKQTVLTPKAWKKCLSNYPKANNKYIATFEVITFRAKKKAPKNSFLISDISRKK